MYKDNNTLVRILEIQLKDYKNVSEGKVNVGRLSNIYSHKADISGIYGQNGSGKTSIISAVGLIKKLLMGNSLPKDIGEYIKYGKNDMEIEVLFYIERSNIKYKVSYSLLVEKIDGESFIKRESLYYWEKEDSDNNKWKKQKGLIINDSDEKNILPKYRNSEIIKLYEDESNFIVNKKIKYRDKESFVFSHELINLIDANKEILGEEYQILGILKDYAFSNLFVIDNQQLALSDANILLPINFKNYKEEQYISMGVMPIGLEEPTYLPKEMINEIETSLVSSNKVISEIIPGLTISLKELSRQISKTGDEEIQVELLSCREGVEIPIKYESDGIKKIVAVIHLLISMFNYRTMTVLIDELDSGIFEYLLGEILEILEERGKGQLTFTSHNLRPLEVLDKNNLIFTTTNPANRYIKLKNVKTNNNLRDMYYRDLVLGGQEETIYDRTNSAKISRAFRKAGE